MVAFSFNNRSKNLEVKLINILGLFYFSDEFHNTEESV
jgi:hypothetical protein